MLRFFTCHPSLLPSTSTFFFYIFLLLLSFPTFPARPLRDTLTDNTTTVLTVTDINLSLQQFERFQNTARSSHVNGLSDVKNKSFHQFDYFPISDTNFTDTYEDRFKSALTCYQPDFDLPITGNHDKMHVFQKKQRFSHFSRKQRWRRRTPMRLSYAFSPDNMIRYISMSDIRAVFERAFSRWAAVIPVSFYETGNYHLADITIGFYSGDHGDGQPFDGALGVIAHAFAPEIGMLHIDADEMWAVDFRKEKSMDAFDLESVVTHEIGHLLGLGHSSVEEAIMYPKISPRTKKVDLMLEDMEGVQALYASNQNLGLDYLVPTTLIILAIYLLWHSLQSMLEE